MFQRDFSLGNLKLDVVDEQQRNAVDCKVRRARKKDEADRLRCAKETSMHDAECARLEVTKLTQVWSNSDRVAYILPETVPF